MLTHKQRILMAARGEMPDLLPYVPRFDLWYNANSWAKTLPEGHKDRTADEIARAEGWALHKVVPELLTVDDPEENIHRGIGLYSLKENGYWITFSSNIDVRVTRLRHKIEDDPAQPKYVRTVWGIGYQFTPEDSPA